MDKIKLGIIIPSRGDRPQFLVNCLRRVAIINPFGEYALKDYYLSKNPGLYFSYYGKKEDAHRILHIGERKR